MAGFAALPGTLPRTQAHVLNTIEGAETLGIGDRNNRVDLSGAAYTITLMPAAEAAGMLFSFVTFGSGLNVSITDNDKSEDWDGNIELGDDSTDTTDLLLYSDGRKWWTLHETVL